MRQGNIISIIGQSGSGKTYLALRLAKELNAKVLLEPEWRKIPKFVQQSFLTQKNLLRAHAWFLKNVQKQMEKALKAREQGKFVVMDLHPIMHLFYAQAFLSKKEQRGFVSKIRNTLRKFPQHDPIIHLYDTEKNILDVRKKRQREHELSVQNKEGNKKVAELVEMYAKKKKNILHINRKLYDFSKKEHVDRIIKKIYVSHS